MDWTDKPFHESIVDAISTTDRQEDFEVLARMISTTKIPKNHDAILQAWRGSKIDERHPHRMSTIACILGKKEQAKMDEEEDHVEAEPIEELVETTFEELNVGDEFSSGEARFRKTGPTRAVEYLPRTGSEYDSGEIDITGRPWSVKKIIRKGK